MERYWDQMIFGLIQLAIAGEQNPNMIMESILGEIRKIITKIDKLLNNEIHEHAELQRKNDELFQEALNRYHADMLLASERLQYKDETYN
jgi:hypothetical protein